MRGDIQFLIRTSLSARLCGYAREAGIALTDVRVKDKRLMEVWVSGKDKKAFIALLKSHALSYQVGSMRGASKIKGILRKKGRLFILIAAGIAFVYLLSGRVWMFDLGSAPEEMSAHLKSAGVFRGVSKKKVDVNALSDLLEAQFPAYSHVGVSLRGVVLVINAVPADRAPDVYDITDACDIVAACDGVVESISVLSGKAMVKPGDVVLKGDILIKGEERKDKQGATYPVRARGSVIARVWTQGESACLLTQTVLTPTGETARESALITPFFTRRLYGENPFSVYTKTTGQTPIVGLFVPVTIETNLYYECTVTAVSIDRDMAKTALYHTAVMKARSLAPEGAYETQLSKASVKEDGNQLTVKAVIEWKMEIALNKGG